MYFSKICSFGSKNIYLGNWNIYNDPVMIDRLNIKNILCIKDYGFDMSEIKKKSINVLNLDLSHQSLFDPVVMKNMIGISNKFIHESLKEGNIYIHCRSGVNRSPIFVMAYLIFTSHGLISPKKAYWKVFKKRSCIKPTYYKQFKKIYKSID